MVRPILSYVHPGLLVDSNDRVPLPFIYVMRRTPVHGLSHGQAPQPQRNRTSQPQRQPLPEGYWCASIPHIAHSSPSPLSDPYRKASWVLFSLVYAADGAAPADALWCCCSRPHHTAMLTLQHQTLRLMNPQAQLVSQIAGGRGPRQGGVGVGGGLVPKARVCSCGP